MEWAGRHSSSNNYATKGPPYGHQQAWAPYQSKPLRFKIVRCRTRFCKRKLRNLPQTSRLSKQCLKEVVWSKVDRRRPYQKGSTAWSLRIKAAANLQTFSKHWRRAVATLAHLATNPSQFCHIPAAYITLTTQLLARYRTRCF